MKQYIFSANHRVTQVVPDKRSLRSYRSNGFTLLELMVVLAITGILVALAGPSFQSLIKNSSISSARDSIEMAVKSARAEALFRKTPVTLCVSTNQSSCAGAGSTWVDGWIIFEDNDADQTIDAGDEMISVNYGIDSLRVGTDDSNGRVTFNASGIKTLAGPWVIGVCDEDESSTLEGDALQISTIGSVSKSDAPGC